jgi:transcriptional regulator with XRE-family HTH domain
MTTQTGALIRSRREQKKLSQSMVAKYVGFSSVFLSRVESGDTLLPAHRIERLSRILDLDKDDLLKVMKKDLSDRLESKSRR